MSKTIKKNKKKERICIDGKWYRLRSNGKPGVELTHNDNWWTKAEFWSMIRSSIKEDTKYWKPKTRYKMERLRPYTGKKKTIKKEGQCEHCKKWFAASNLQVDHIIPCGSLRGEDDLLSFLKRTFIESQEGWQLLCLECHKLKTNTERRRNESKG